MRGIVPPDARGRIKEQISRGGGKGGSVLFQTTGGGRSDN